MSSVIVSVENGIARISLNRPEKLNSLTREMALQFQEALSQAAADRTIRAVKISGEGRAFCAGQDLAEVQNGSEDISVILAEQLNPIVLLIRSLNKPVLAAVQGTAAGAGANIALCCDIVLAGENAKFIQAFSRIGLIPDSGGTFFLPRLAGYQKATALMMLGEPITAREAERIGMIYKVFSDLDLDLEAEKILAQLAGMPTVALALTKKAILASAGNDLEQQLQLEDELQKQAAATEDFKEGVAAFAEKRRAIFKGR